MDLSSIELHHVAWAIAGLASLGSCSIAMYMIWKHLENYTEPRIQVFIVRIIIMVPIYTIDSYLSLIFRKYGLYFDLARDCYEAYVLYMFFKLLIELADGEENLINRLENMRQVRYSIPLCCFHIKPGRIFLHRCKQMIFQYVLFKPLLAISSFILQLTGEYHEGNYSTNSGYLYIAILYNLSITISLYFLVLFYEVTKDILAHFKPLSKFLCIKAIIFFSFWQSLVISGMAKWEILVKEEGDWSEEEVTRGLQAFLICVEMFPLSIAFFKTFGYKSFREPLVSMSFGDKSVITNFAHIANMRDVIDDTIISMKKGPKRNVQAGDFMSLSREDQLKRIVKQGWLGKRGEDLAKIWKNRYFVLIRYPKGLIYFKMNPYQPDRNGNMPEVFKARGFINFEVVTNVKHHSNKAFHIVTPMRTWHFKCYSEYERDEWVAAINQMLPQLSYRPPVPLDV